MATTKAVNPTFRLDVTGKLFLNKETNIDIQDTITFNSLFTRLSITKGDLAIFPNVGLQQFLHLFEFNTEEQIAENIMNFEKEATSQLGKECTIDYTLDAANKSVAMSFSITGLEYGINFEYRSINNSIKVINYRFDDSSTS